jgi:APA family basic amino acid/polyamine antiporter
MNLFRRRKMSDLQAEVLEDHSLRRALGPLNLTTLGIGAVIGAGIFVLTGQAAANYAGPAIVFSFILAGIACGLAGLCYAEFSSMIPISGSAYTYSYATLGELVAWIIGWDLILEYLFAAATVAVGWSGYVVSFLKDLGVVIPAAFTEAPYIHVAPKVGPAPARCSMFRPCASLPSSPCCWSSAFGNQPLSTTSSWLSN